MSAARVTYYFGQGSGGWSETWWHPDGISTSIWKRIEDLAKARVGALNTQHELVGVRVSEEGGDRFTRLFLGGGVTTINANSGTIDLPGRGAQEVISGKIQEGPPDQLRAAMHLEIIRGGRRIALRYLAGIPDSISLTENPTINKNPIQGWWDLFGNWRSKVLADGWTIKQLDKTAAFPLIAVQTYRLRDAAPSVLGVVIDSAQPWTIAVGGKVALQGVRMREAGWATPNKTYFVDGVEVNSTLGQRTIWLRASEGYDPSIFATLGKIRGVSYTYVAPEWIEPIRVGIHKRGKAFGSPVGRRKTR